MALLDHHGNQITPEEIGDQSFSNGRSAKVVAATDMDNTMFENDLGPLVFLEKLADPHFWELGSSEFSRILLPKKYRELLRRGKNNEIPELKPIVCDLALDLGQDIMNLYDMIQTVVQTKPEPNGEQPLIEEFARKMVELDRIFFMIDAVLSKYLDGEILMRTRFFAGKDPSVIHNLTQKVMRRQRTAVGRFLDLGIHDENHVRANQIVTEDRISEVHGDESPFKQIDRLVKPVLDVQKITRHLITHLHIPTVVATGNLKAIAKTAVAESDYGDFMHKQRYIKKGGSLVVGTWLRAAEDGTLHPRVRNKPILGDRKAKAVMDFANDRDKMLGLALGDSPSTDGPMIQAALALNGAAVIVGKDIDTIRRRFEKVLPREQRYQEKVYYVVDNK